MTGPKAAIPRILAIAGSDSGGGAGIQADIKTITMMGGFAMTAITAVTVQNTLGVSAIHPIPPRIVAAQISEVLSDLGADAIKIGMLGDVDVIEAVTQCLSGVTLPIVLDPVMVAKGGALLLKQDAEAALHRLLPLAAVVTPNAPELSALVGMPVEDEASLMAAGQALLAKGARAVLAKGGHLPGDDVVDLLLTAEGVERFSHSRIETRHSHGTGCTLASAVATGLAKGLSLPDSIREARDYLHSALKAAPGLGQGHGPLGHNFALR